MRTNDIGRIVTVGSPAVSPDGARVAYTVTRVDLDENRYRSAIWLAAADGSTPPRQLTTGEGGDGQPAWSPDGTRLAFTRKRDPEGEAPPEQVLLVVPVDGPGEPVSLAHRGEAIEHPVWSPDGRSIAFTSRVRAARYEPKDEAAQPPRKIDRLFSRLNGEDWTIDRPTQAFVVDSEAAAAPRQLTEGPEVSGPLAWSPDSGRVAFVSARQPDADLNPVDDLWTLDINIAEDARPEPVRLTATEAAHLGPAFSPDGGRLAYLAFHGDATHPGYYHWRLEVLDLLSRQVTRLALDLDRSLFPYPEGRPPVWEGGDLLVSVEDRGSVHVLRVDAAGSSTRAVDGLRTVTAWDLAGGTLAFTGTDATHPTELYSLVGGRERRLTHHQEAFLGAVPALSPERFTVRTRDGKEELDTWLLRPPGFEPDRTYPALLSIHGGPATQYGERWFDEFQFLAAAGFVVFWTNPRGASGVTEAFGRAILSPLSTVDPGSGWGGVDYEDLMAVTDAALEREPAIDRERVGVLGGSYGGFMTSWIVGHTHRFAAACSERAVNNLLSEDWSSDAAGGFAQELGVDPLENPQEYARMSPITYVKVIATPLLILHSENDLRCPIEQADCLFVALRRLGRRDVEYYRFPAENHELSRAGSPKHRVQRADLIVEFFRRHLGLEGQGAEGHEEEKAASSLSLAGL